MCRPLSAIVDLAGDLAAMLIIYAILHREPRLLIDPDHSSAAVKKDVALVVGHELAHQWFGNLVSSL